MLFQAVLLEIQDAVAKAGQVVREAVGGLQTVRSFGAEEHEVCRYKEALERCRQLWWRRDLERALYLLLRRVRRLSGGWKGPGRGRESLRLALGSLLGGPSVLGTGRGKSGKSLAQPHVTTPPHPLPDGALGDAGADAELWAAADPGWEPHPGRPALLSALPGGRGPLCACELGATHALFVPFCFSLCLPSLRLCWFPLKIENKTKQSQFIVF